MIEVAHINMRSAVWYDIEFTKANVSLLQNNKKPIAFELKIARR